MKKLSFTLVELILVLAIIAFSASAVAAVVNQNRNKTLKSENLILEKVELPEASGYVVDTIGLLDNDTRAQIESICTNLDPIAQVAVCIVDTTYPLSIDEYSIKLAEKWKVGYKGKDNGIILILAKSDRKVRIEIGRGIEYKISDGRAGEILDNDIIPCFKQGEWSKGILSGIYAIEKRLK